VSGAIWDTTGVPALAFVPLALCGVAMTATTAIMWRSGELR
jgi:hypothetical protein